MTSEQTGTGGPTGRPVALVTGCSSGIGLRTVAALVDRGFHVVATMRDLSRRGAVDEPVRDHVCVRALDVLDPDGVAATVDAVIRDHGRIDVLVNNAGVAVPGFVEEATPGQWRQVFETNLFGQVTVTNAVLAPMRTAGRGHVVMISSVGGRAVTPVLGVYCASKFALEGYAETLRLELLGSGITVSLVEPGSFRTGMYDHPMLTRRFPADSPYAADFVHLQRFYLDHIAHDLADPGQVARSVADLAAGRRRRTLRHPVGRDARIKLALRAMLPWTVYERLVRRTLGLSTTDRRRFPRVIARSGGGGDR